MSTKGNILITEPLYSEEYLRESKTDADEESAKYRREKCREESIKKNLSKLQQILATEKKILMHSLLLASKPDVQMLLAKDPDTVDPYLRGLREDFDRLEKYQKMVMQEKATLEKKQKEVSVIMQRMNRFKVCPAGVLKAPQNMAKRKLLEEGITLCSYNEGQPYKRIRREIVFGNFDADAVLGLIKKDPDQLATYLHQKALIEQMFFDPEEHKKHDQDWNPRSCPLCWPVEKLEDTISAFDRVY
jgi:hypothetical protein